MELSASSKNEINIQEDAVFKKTKSNKILPSSEEDKNYIHPRLTDFNRQKVPFSQSPDFIFFNYHIRNDEGQVIAGINATLYAWNILFIDILFVEEGHRHQNLDTQLLKHVEEEAKERGAYLILLDTFDFQAKDFYLRHGFKVFGIVKNCPPGHKRFYLKKTL